MPASYQGRGMLRATRLGRRLGNVMSTYGVARLGTYALFRAAAALPPGELARFFSGVTLAGITVTHAYARAFTTVAPPLQWEWACAFHTLLGIVIEGLPEDSPFWRLPLHRIHDVFSVFIKVAFLYGLYNRRMDLWVTVLWYLATFLLALFR